MIRLATAAALAAATFSFVPSASACSPAYDPGCQTGPCPTVDHYWFVIRTIVLDPPPQPIC